MTHYIIGSRALKCKNNLWEVIANLLQVLNLIFDPCFKVKWGHYIKTSYISLIFGSRASKCEVKAGIKLREI